MGSVEEGFDALVRQLHQFGVETDNFLQVVSHCHKAVDVGDLSHRKSRDVGGAASVSPEPQTSPSVHKEDSRLRGESTLSVASDASFFSRRSAASVATNSPNARRLAQEWSENRCMDLQLVFELYCIYGTNPVAGQKPKTFLMDGPRFVKVPFSSIGADGLGLELQQMFRDAKLLDKKLKSTTVDLVFTQVKTKGSRKLNYSQFEKAVIKIAEKRGEECESVVARLVAQGGPVTNDSIKRMNELETISQRSGQSVATSSKGIRRSPGKTVMETAMEAAENVGRGISVSTWAASAAAMTSERINEKGGAQSNASNSLESPAVSRISGVELSPAVTTPEAGRWEDENLEDFLRMEAKAEGDADEPMLGLIVADGREDKLENAGGSGECSESGFDKHEVRDGATSGAVAPLHPPTDGVSGEAGVDSPTQPNCDEESAVDEVESDLPTQPNCDEESAVDEVESAAPPTSLPPMKIKRASASVPGNTNDECEVEVTAGVEEPLSGNSQINSLKDHLETENAKDYDEGESVTPGATVKRLAAMRGVVKMASAISRETRLKQEERELEERRREEEEEEMRKELEQVEARRKAEAKLEQEALEKSPFMEPSSWAGNSVNDFDFDLDSAMDDFRDDEVTHQGPSRSLFDEMNDAAMSSGSEATVEDQREKISSSDKPEEVPIDNVAILPGSSDEKVSGKLDVELQKSSQTLEASERLDENLEVGMSRIGDSSVGCTPGELTEGGHEESTEIQKHAQVSPPDQGSAAGDVQVETQDEGVSGHATYQGLLEQPESVGKLDVELQKSSQTLEASERLDENLEVGMSRIGDSSVGCTPGELTEGGHEESTEIQKHAQVSPPDQGSAAGDVQVETQDEGVSGHATYQDLLEQPESVQDQCGSDTAPNTSAGNDSMGQSEHASPKECETTAALIEQTESTGVAGSASGGGESVGDEGVVLAFRTVSGTDEITPCQTPVNRIHHQYSFSSVGSETESMMYGLEHFGSSGSLRRGDSFLTEEQDMGDFYSSYVEGEFLEGVVPTGSPRIMTHSSPRSRPPVEPAEEPKNRKDEEEKKSPTADVPSTKPVMESAPVLASTSTSTSTSTTTAQAIVKTAAGRDKANNAAKLKGKVKGMLLGVRRMSKQQPPSTLPDTPGSDSAAGSTDGDVKKKGRGLGKLLTRRRSSMMSSEPNTPSSVLAPAAPSLTKAALDAAPRLSLDKRDVSEGSGGKAGSECPSQAISKVTSIRQAFDAEGTSSVGMVDRSKLKKAIRRGDGEMNFFKGDERKVSVSSAFSSKKARTRRLSMHQNILEEAMSSEYSDKSLRTFAGTAGTDEAGNACIYFDLLGFTRQYHGRSESGRVDYLASLQRNLICLMNSIFGQPFTVTILGGVEGPVSKKWVEGLYQLLRDSYGSHLRGTYIIAATKSFKSSSAAFVRGKMTKFHLENYVTPAEALALVPMERIPIQAEFFELLASGLDRSSKERRKSVSAIPSTTIELTVRRMRSFYSIVRETIEDHKTLLETTDSCCDDLGSAFSFLETVNQFKRKAAKIEKMIETHYTTLGSQHDLTKLQFDISVLTDHLEGVAIIREQCTILKDFLREHLPPDDYYELEDLGLPQTNHIPPADQLGPETEGARALCTGDMMVRHSNMHTSGTMFKKGTKKVFVSLSPDLCSLRIGSKAIDMGSVQYVMYGRDACRAQAIMVFDENSRSAMCTFCLAFLGEDSVMKSVGLTCRNDETLKTWLFAIQRIISPPAERLITLGSYLWKRAQMKVIRAGARYQMTGKDVLVTVLRSSSVRCKDCNKLLLYERAKEGQKQPKVKCVVCGAITAPLAFSEDANEAAFSDGQSENLLDDLESEGGNTPDGSRDLDNSGLGEHPAIAANGSLDTEQDAVPTFDNLHAQNSPPQTNVPLAEPPTNPEDDELEQYADVPTPGPESEAGVEGEVDGGEGEVDETSVQDDGWDAMESF